MTVYVIKNFTLKELYFGSCDGNAQDEIQRLKSDDLSPVGHWQWDKEAVKWGEIDRDLNENLAKSFIAALRREPPDDGWTIVVGGENLD